MWITDGPSMNREQLLAQLASMILSIQQPHPIRVAVDGIDAAGKTTLADELAARIETRRRAVLRASLDGFHHPRAMRYRRGRHSPEGYYYDSFNYTALKDSLLLPLGPGGDRRCRLGIFDFRTDSPVNPSFHDAPADAVLLFDGVFLQRPELNPHWDYRIFLEVDFNVGLQRALQRDGSHFTSNQAILERYEGRYFPGQCIYLQTVRPQQYAHVLIDNNDPGDPFFL